jgi:pimeloyl-ACP methyl ester carboxylesterase
VTDEPAKQKTDDAPGPRGAAGGASAGELPAAAPPNAPGGDARDDLAHFPVGDLAWSRDDDFLPGSLAMLSRAPVVEKAVVFVHGWGGSASGTWEQFPTALRAMPEAALADAFFLDYPSTTLSVAVCAGELKELLVDLLRAPGAHVVNPSLPEEAPPRPAGWRYRRVLLVAHSMGAVVARRALLDLDRADLTVDEATAVRLLFFAPAHLGSSLPLLVASGLGLDWLPGASLVGRALRAHYRSLADLEEGSNALRLLSEDSRSARARRAAAQEPDDDLRAHVLHARNDKVVVQDRFDEDLDGRPIPHRNHRSACKPSHVYRLPVEALQGLL